MAYPQNVSSLLMPEQDQVVLEMNDAKRREEERRRQQYQNNMGIDAPLIGSNLPSEITGQGTPRNVNSQFTHQPQQEVDPWKATREGFDRILPNRLYPYEGNVRQSAQEDLSPSEMTELGLLATEPNVPEQPAQKTTDVVTDTGEQKQVGDGSPTQDDTATAHSMITSSPETQRDMDLAKAQKVTAGMSGAPQYQFEEYSDNGSWQAGLLSAGMVILTAALAGAEGEDMQRAIAGAAAAGFSTFGEYEGIRERSKNRAALQAQGYADKDIAAWERSGEADDLIATMRENQFLKPDQEQKRYFKEGEINPVTGEKMSEGNYTRNTTYDRMGNPTYGDWTYQGDPLAPQKMAVEIKAQERRDAEQAAAEAAAVQADQEALTSHMAAEDVLGVINQIGEDDIANAGGYSSMGGYWSTSSRGSEALFNQLGSKQFLEGIEAMRGMGALSDKEGSKISGAANALIDPNTGTLRTGLPENFIREQLNIMRTSSKKMQYLANYKSQFGREPSKAEYHAISRQFDQEQNANDPLGIR
ncbi:hypothetical protein G3R49_19260 [Shewanella sp. WXL01]|uniref:hypothetical protein n=1 Tax=Shewanella sp. WXL01 TaxID=2709721 RepID=UPI0014386823|nr:hypothetical protein [Shewanella sp. WXL01]NKF52698.1 hypothetical protein [Shewanella sp. WXL01]